MRDRTTLLSLSLALMLILFGDQARTQIIYGQPSVGNIGVVYSSWSQKDINGKIDIKQFMIPVNGFVALKPGFEATVFMANSSNKLNKPQNDYSLSGLGDARVQFSHSFMNDGILASAGVNVPIGKKELNLSNEWAVVDYLSQNYLDFPMSRFGEGFGFNLLLGGATMLGALKCGAGVMYEYTGSYKPYQNAGDYNPGDIFSVNGGIDWKTGRSAYSTEVIFTNYASDKLNDKKVFRQARQYDLRLGWMYDHRNWNFNSLIRYLIRDRNTFYEFDTTLLSPNFVTKQFKLFGNEFTIMGSLSKSLSKNWIVVPSAQLRLIAANELNLGKSSIFGIGSDLNRKIGRTASFGVGFKYFTGNTNGGDIDLSGFQLTAGLTAGI